MSTLGDMLKYLPPRLAEAIAEECGRLGADDGAGAGQHCFVTELRLRRELPCSLTLSDGRNIPMPISARRSELSAVLARMTENSLHTHAAALRQGYIRLPDGSRVGVCGRAAERSQSGSAVGIGEINSMCIRISHPVCGVSDGIYEHLRSRRFEGGVLFYGPPASGKTTLLRELAFRAASGSQPMRVALIDSRGELGCICDSGGSLGETCGSRAASSSVPFGALIDRYDGYSKADGIAQATRVLSPELIVCDEIGGEEEVRAILETQNTGVPLLASAHAPSYEALLRRPHIRELIENAVFSECVGVCRDDSAPGGLRFTVTDCTGARTDKRTGIRTDRPETYDIGNADINIKSPAARDDTQPGARDGAKNTDCTPEERRERTVRGGFGMPSSGGVHISGAPRRRVR